MIFFFGPFLVNCRRRTLEIVFEIEYNRLIVVASGSGETDQTFLIGMEDDRRRVAITGDNCRMTRNVLRFSKHCFIQ